MSRVVGSSYYVSPQVLERRYDERCDEWSLGVIAYMLLSGAPAFSGPTDAAIKSSILSGRYSFPSQLFPPSAVSSAAKTFVSSLLTFDPEERERAKDALEGDWLKEHYTKNCFSANATTSSGSLCTTDTEFSSMSKTKIPIGVDESRA